MDRFQVFIEGLSLISRVEKGEANAKNADLDHIAPNLHQLIVEKKVDRAKLVKICTRMKPGPNLVNSHMTEKALHDLD